MRRDLIRIPPLNSSFLSCEKDMEIILRRLFIESQPYSDVLKRLLVINTLDCWDNDNPVYNQKVKEMTLKKLKDDGYIKLAPKIALGEHEEKKSYLLIDFDNFVTNDTNPQFRDCMVSFDIICHTDCWDIGNYRIRPLKIAGYIDGILNNSRLTGIGTLQFLGCNKVALDDKFAGYSLMYLAIHGYDDKIDNEDEDLEGIANA